jgi:hypothetical protein
VLAFQIPFGYTFAVFWIASSLKKQINLYQIKQEEENGIEMGLF